MCVSFSTTYPFRASICFFHSHPGAWHSAHVQQIFAQWTISQPSSDLWTTPWGFLDLTLQGSCQLHSQLYSCHSQCKYSPSIPFWTILKRANSFNWSAQPFLGPLHFLLIHRELEWKVSCELLELRKYIHGDPSLTNMITLSRTEISYRYLLKENVRNTQTTVSEFWLHTVNVLKIL